MIFDIIKTAFRMITYITGISLAIIGILIFNPLVTLIGLGLSLTIFLPRESD